MPESALHPRQRPRPTPPELTGHTPLMKFRTVVELHGKTATGLEVPAGVVAGLGSSKRPAVLVTIGDVTYRSTIAPMGGRFLIPLSADRRAACGLAAGDDVDVEVELDTAPREVLVPADLAAALAADPTVRRQFDALSYSGKSGHVQAIEAAKTPATRERRIAKVVTDLARASTGA